MVLRQKAIKEFGEIRQRNQAAAPGGALAALEDHAFHGWAIAVRCCRKHKTVEATPAEPGEGFPRATTRQPDVQRQHIVLRWIFS